MYHHFVTYSMLLFQDLDGEREVNKEEVLEYCNSSDVNVPLIETSAKVCSPSAVHFRQYVPIVIGTKAEEGLLTHVSQLQNYKSCFLKCSLFSWKSSQT